ncbi:uncharacterized protein LOC121875456 [Homarus americanus]|uniref:Uncharacterized protein n=1 Tax=Homarus americanus TaxID=6706 RepID=A0A8J5NBM1_HOMAM|nr:uncharacterized protein LOC121875456 [Homarus americanus]KAG7176456.1 hypothetical protein Hamer_G021447 [Homarus americanus]
MMTAEDYPVVDRLEEIWRTGQELGLSQAQIHHVFDSVFNEEKEKEAIISKSHGSTDYKRTIQDIARMITSYLKIFTKFLVFLTAVCIVVFIVISLHNPTRKLVTRNIQDVIYPFMTTLRYLTLPILTRYPHLSQWYSEECLVPNVFYDQPSIDCMPCSKDPQPIKTAGLQNFTDMYYNNGRIIIVTDAMLQNMTWGDLTKELDIKQEFEIGAFKYFSETNTSMEALRWFVKEETINSDDHIEWRINRLETLHVVRQIFPRMYFIPSETEVALHRFVYVDGPEADSYPLPLTEFANVVLIQGEGKSVLTLSPSSHCQDICNSVTVTLDTTHVLFFNWIYWRPVRVGGESISTLAMSSFY